MRTMKTLMRSLACVGLMTVLIGATTVNANNPGNKGKNGNEAVSITEMAIPQIELKLRTTGEDGETYSTLLAFTDDATDGFDHVWDKPLAVEQGVLSLFSELDKQPMAIQAWPGVKHDRIVPIGLEANMDGEFIIDASDMKYFEETAMIILEDRHTGIMQNLTVNPEYHFQAEALNNSGRLFLHFRPPLTLETYEESCLKNDGEILLEQYGSTSWNWILVDQQEQLIDIGADMNGIHIINGLKGGKYTLTLSTNDGYHLTKKLIVPAKESVTADFFITDYNTNEMNDVQLVNLSTGATDYQWNMGDGAIVTGVKHPQHRYTSEGIFEIKLKASNGECADDAMKSIEVSATPNGLQATVEKDLSIYAANGSLIVENLGSINVSELFIHNVIGQSIYEKDVNVSNSVIKIKISDLVDGQYLVNLRMDNGQFVSRKVVVKS